MNATTHKAGSVAERREKWLAGQNAAFRATINGEPLETALNVLIASAIEQVDGTSQCAFYIVSEDGTALRHVAGMPDGHARDVDRFPIGWEALASRPGSGTVEPVITPDVREEPLWKPWLRLAEQAGYRGCWSFPVETSPGNVVGTFAMYFPEPRSPTPEDLHFAQSLTGTAAIIIAQYQGIAAMQRAHELQVTLAAELQHRVRNVLAIIRSMIGRAGANKSDVEDLVSHLQGRISALARTQSMLTRNPGDNVDLEDILTDEMLAGGAVRNWKIKLEGPQVSLSSKAAEVLTLAVHELATNSIKYGALANGGGLTVRWSTEKRNGEDWLILSWQERGIEVADRNPKPGFGTELITERVPYELGGESQMKFTAKGLTAVMSFPLRGRSSILRTDAGLVTQEA